jgi:fructuronate reductase
MLASIRFHLAHGSGFDCLALGWQPGYVLSAGWMSRGKLPVSDPLAGEISHLLISRMEGESTVRALLKLEQVFGTDLPCNAHFVERLEQQFQLLQQYGAKACIALTCSRLGLVDTLA